MHTENRQDWYREQVRQVQRQAQRWAQRQLGCRCRDWGRLCKAALSAWPRCLRGSNAEGISAGCGVVARGESGHLVCSSKSTAAMDTAARAQQ
eukprot:3220766-Rhodomonas_salina.2